MPSTTHSHPSPERIIRLSEVRARTGLGKSSIYARIAQGTFPRPFPIEMRRDGRASIVGFAESEIEERIRAKIAASRQAPASAAQPA